MYFKFLSLQNECHSETVHTFLHISTMYAVQYDLIIEFNEQI